MASHEPAGERREPRGHRRRRWGMARSVVALLLSAVLLGACGAGATCSDGPAPSRPGPSGTTGEPGASGLIAAGLVVEISEVGGFVSPVALATRVPELAL